MIVYFSYSLLYANTKSAILHVFSASNTRMCFCGPSLGGVFTKIPVLSTDLNVKITINHNQ